MLFFVPGPLLKVLGQLGASLHFQNIARGIVDSRDLIYFISVAFLGLYAAHLAMQEKK